MSITVDEYKELANKMADALAEIDPNTKNGEEGKAFVKKMYKIRS